MFVPHWTADLFRRINIPSDINKQMINEFIYSRESICFWFYSICFSWKNIYYHKISCSVLPKTWKHKITLTITSMGTYAVVAGIQTVPVTVSRFPLKYSTKQNKTSKITGKKRKKPQTDRDNTVSRFPKTTIVLKQTHSDRSKIHLNGYSTCQI